MALIEQQIEHEFLFRWDEVGNPQGCHIAYREAIVDDATGVERSSRFLDPRPVQLADADKLAEIGAAINTAALAGLAAAQAERDTALAALQEAQAARDLAMADAQALRDKYETGGVINGVPQRVTMRQAQLALLAVGLLDQVDAAIAAIPDATQRRAAEITWTKSAAMERDNPLIAQLAPALGLSSAQIDALFIAAAQL